MSRSHDFEESLVLLRFPQRRNQMCDNQRSVRRPFFRGVGLALALLRLHSHLQSE